MTGSKAGSPPCEETGMARQFAKAFYKSKEWQNVRAAALLRDAYLCVMCGQPAEEVHHIKHINKRNVMDPSVTLNLDNLACLCRACHMKEHIEDKANGNRAKAEAGYPYTFDENGMLIMKASPL